MLGSGTPMKIYENYETLSFRFFRKILLALKRRCCYPAKSLAKKIGYETLSSTFTKNNLFIPNYTKFRLIFPVNTRKFCVRKWNPLVQLWSVEILFWQIQRNPNYSNCFNRYIHFIS
jgi:hypothetical protein